MTLLLIGTVNGKAGEPLHVRIDQVIGSSEGSSPAPVVGDLDFLRRVYLDLTGTTPPSSVARAFLADASPDKRRAVIDRLLHSPDYARFMSSVFDVMLMERRGDKHVKIAEWQKYLFDSFLANKPYNQLVRELLSSDGMDANLRPAAKFVLDREVETNTLARDIGRIFFGMDLTCAQCHDHPSIDGFKQADYFGLYAFMNRSYLFTDKEKKVFVADKAEGDVNFTSVFTKESNRTVPRLPGDSEITEPSFNKGEEYSVAPAENVRPVPKYSRRLKLAELAASGSNRAFNRNIANRLWAHMLGAGLVDPLEMNHYDNPPSHGQLLDVLADEFVALKFDVRAFLREVALSQTYQRALEIPATGFAEQAKVVAALVEAAVAEHEKLATLAAQSSEETKKHSEGVKQALQTAAPITEEMNKANAAVTEAKKAAEAAAAALADAQKKQTAKQEIAAAVSEAAQKAQEAATKLSGEKDLAQAAEIFKVRSVVLAAELAAAVKTVTDFSVPVKTTADALTAAQQAAATVAIKLAAVDQQITQLKLQERNSELKASSERATVSQAFARLVLLKMLTEYGTRLSNLNGIQTTVAAVQNELSTRKQTVDRLAVELPKRQSDLVQSQKSNEEAVKELGEVTQQRDAKQAAVSTFAEVVSKTEAASQKLPDDAELKKAALAVKTRSDQLAAELAEMQKTFAAKGQLAKDAAEKLTTVQQAVTNMQTEMTNAQQRMPILESQLKEDSAKLETEKIAVKSVLEKLNQKWVQRFYVAALRAKTPDQVSWSILQATGVLDNYREAAEAEVNKTLPPDPADSAKMTARAAAIEQNAYDQLKPSTTAFIGLFGHAPGQPQGAFFATADQALFFGNSGVLTGWLAPSGNNLTSRLLKLEDPRAFAMELYISVLTRQPSEEEVVEVTQTLAARAAEKANVAQELAWALITSAEFRFVH